MDFIKKCGIFLGALLLIVSVYKDLTSGSMNFPEKQPKTEVISNSIKFNVVKVKVQSGDTVLSIIEKVNKEQNRLDINQILTDFQMINDTNPHDLQVGNDYYFPIYK